MIIAIKELTFYIECIPVFLKEISDKILSDFYFKVGAYLLKKHSFVKFIPFGMNLLCFYYSLNVSNREEEYMTDPIKENNYETNGTSFITGYNNRFLFVVTNLCIHMNKNTNAYRYRNIYILLSLYTENTNKTRVCM